MPADRGVVEGGVTPYKPEALAKKKANFANRWRLDLEVKCHMPGIPRATYMQFPFQIVQSANVILMSYEYASANRVINMGKPSRRRSTPGWVPKTALEDETLVVDNTGFNDLSWFDRAGDFHSDALHVVERFTRVDADHINYEAAIEDPQTFTGPWKIGLPLFGVSKRTRGWASSSAWSMSRKWCTGTFGRKSNRGVDMNHRALFVVAAGVIVSVPFAKGTPM